MQQPARTKSAPGPACAAGITAVGLAVLTALAALVGCDDGRGPSPQGPGADRPFAGTTLAVRCPDARLAGILAPLAKVWATRTGAEVTVTAGALTPGDAAQVGVLPYAELGGWADRGELLSVPAGVKEPGHPYQWSGVLGVYRGEPFAGWGGRLLGLPLAGDGAVVVYRSDRFADPRAKEDFRARFSRPLAAPTTWEDFADAAAFFADRDKRPSLPRVTADPARLADLFDRVAACYDRPALGEAAAAGGQINPDALAFHFRLDTGAPRLDAPGFRAAAAWLAGLKTRGCLPADGPADPAAALAGDRAVLAVLTLGELAGLKRGGRVPDRYGVAPLPGTRKFADPKTGELVATAAGPNYVPHFAGGWVGVVRKDCPNPEAAWDLLATLGGPARSAEVVAAGGYGPTRDAHLDQTQLLVWLGYGFDPEKSKVLQDALRHFVGKAVRNPTYGPRGPDRAALTAALGAELAKVAAGEVPPAEAMPRVSAAWEKADAGTPAEKVREWRRRAAGLN